MRILPLILIILLGLELGLPYQSCQMGDSCHTEEVEAAATAEAAHDCCASKAAAEHEHDEGDCQEDCSCSCCRVLVNVYQAPAELAETSPLSPRLPVFKHNLRLLNLGPAIWEPPQRA